MKPISIYDEISFPSYPHPVSHPARLATIARLRGLESPRIEQCRVLEIGCDTGGNLIPLAEALPNSRFWGIDLSERQISIAREHASAIGLTNISFQVSDVIQWDGEGQPFDYILCHGVFSWTTDATRKKILSICRDLLTETGVAYINYNTYPGWHLQGMLRDMLCYHAGRWSDVQQRVSESRAMIEFLLAAMPPQESPYAALLRNELDGMRRKSDPFLFHAYLNVVNQPYYLHQFVEFASQFNLGYLGDGDPDAMWAGGASPQLERQLLEITSREKGDGAKLHDPIADIEQYYDFVRFSMSRRSLLCHKNSNIRALPQPADLNGLHASAPLGEQTPPTGAPAGSVTFATANGRSLTTSDQRLVASLRLLSQAWPESRPIEWLEQETQAYVSSATTSAAGTENERWRSHLLRCFTAGLMDLSVQASLCGRSIGVRPCATRFARRQSSRQNFVANLKHATVYLDEFDRLVLQQLDGNQTEEQIVAAIEAARPTNDAQNAVRNSLRKIASQGLLLATDSAR